MDEKKVHVLLHPLSRERESDDKDEMLEERTERIAEELKEEFLLVVK